MNLIFDINSLFLCSFYQAQFDAARGKPDYEILFSAISLSNIVAQRELMQNSDLNKQKLYNSYFFAYLIEKGKYDCKR
jgi:hypothetical protein